MNIMIYLLDIQRRHQFSFGGEKFLVGVSYYSSLRNLPPISRCLSSRVGDCLDLPADLIVWRP
jgi:hypothetical protein